MPIAELTSPVLVEDKMMGLLQRLFGRAATAPHTAATLQVTPSHDDQVIVIDKATGVTVTLPAASGSGRKYKFLIKTATSGGSTIIKVGNTTDTMVGVLIGCTAAGTGSFIEALGGTDDTITMSGTTTGGLVGTYIEITDIQPGLFYVDGRNIGSGTMITSVSASV